MIKTFITGDGSLGLYNVELDEIYHSKFGAKTEAYEKFVEPVLNIKSPRILDICYGIGYNTKTAIEYLNNIDFIDCIEIDEALAKNSYKYEYSDSVNKIIEKNLKNPDFIHFYFEDARKTVKNLNKKYNIIFHDGFAPYKQPELWSEDFIFAVINLLDKEGIYVTYNHSKPVLNALNKTGITIGKTIKSDKYIGTIASFNSDLIKNKLSDFEIETLNTKSAITYKDKNLSLNSLQILNNRKKEIEKSSLITLSAFIKKEKSNSVI
ncbi:MAG: hypothetical protein IKR34_04295 [Candidatus Gastranaerophilales bacterium]|nr:hypothetical protein [Candidatus Gastranaerophilales bacterium]